MSLIARDNRPAALTLWPPATILLITQTELLWAVSGGGVGGSQEHGSVCLRRLQRTRRVGEGKGREGGVKILLTTASLVIRNSAKICIHLCKQGQATKEDGKHTCTHCRVLAPGMQTHFSDTAGRRKTSTQTWAHTTGRNGW